MGRSEVPGELPWQLLIEEHAHERSPRSLKPSPDMSTNANHTYVELVSFASSGIVAATVVLYGPFMIRIVFASMS